MKLFRLLRIGRIFKKLDAVFGAANISRIIKLLVIWLMLTHWLGCLFWWVGAVFEDPNGNQYTGVPWVVNSAHLSLLGADLRTQYTSAIYWALTTITTTGYGDIVPTTNTERGYAMGVMLFGAVFYAFIFGNISMTLQNLSRQTAYVLFCFMFIILLFILLSYNSSPIAGTSAPASTR